MMTNKTITDYWFIVEPYVYIGLTDKYVLLYNTLDSVTIKSEKVEIVELIREVLQKDNYGTILLSNEKYQNKSISAFIMELRKKYMGDIIEVSLSKGKPIQPLPLFNFIRSDMHEIYERQNFSIDRNILDKLSEVCIHINCTTNIKKLLSFLQSIPDNLSLKIIGNFEEVTNYEKLLFYMNSLSSLKTITCSYMNIIPLQPTYNNNYSYSIVIDFPINLQLWNKSRQVLLNQSLPIEYIFNVSSLNDCQEAELLIEQFQLENYQLKPVYTGTNIEFFKENIFLSEEDILFAHISLKNIFANQSINTYDFGKINIMPNGDTFANINHPSLGNIYTDSLYDIVRKEISEGKSWLRIRNHPPCNGCIYQWLCPSPSDYEIAIGYSNLCHINPHQL